ncbi:MAG TPA: hypothetical protein VKZ67_12870 [Natronosporangium sp.]|nr:hypothetical protein [Natronosporangium sp.]
MNRTFPRAVLTALLVSGLLLLTGCMKLNVTLSIQDDHTVDGSIVFAVEAETAQQLGIDPADLRAAQGERVPLTDGVTVTPYHDGAWVGTEYTFTQVSLDDLASDAAGGPEWMRISYDAETGTYEFWAVVDFTVPDDLPSGELDALGDLGMGLPFVPMDLAGAWRTLEANVAVTFPGEVVTHNGELAGSTVTWHVPGGERTELHAVARVTDDRHHSASDEGFPLASLVSQTGSGWWWFGAVGLLVALGAAALAFVLVPRGRRTAPTAPVPVTTPAHPPSPPPYFDR